ncbi:MAG: lipid-A-disaccharide synthase N-terminal domain-containing protein [Verrucomicrobiales bacterium]
MPLLAHPEVDPEGLIRPFLGDSMPWLYVDSVAWTAVGLAGAGLFSSRFLIQWLTSEKEKKLVVPPLFWHLSFWGSVLNLIYALHIDKLPIILGCCFLPFLYGRNLVLLRRSGGKHLK